MAEMLQQYTKKDGDLPFEEIEGGRYFDTKGVLRNGAGEKIRPDGTKLDALNDPKEIALREANEEIERLRAMLQAKPAETSVELDAVDELDTNGGVDLVSEALSGKRPKGPKSSTEAPTGASGQATTGSEVTVTE